MLSPFSLSAILFQIKVGQRQLRFWQLKLVMTDLVKPRKLPYSWLAQVFRNYVMVILTTWQRKKLQGVPQPSKSPSKKLGPPRGWGNPMNNFKVEHFVGHPLKHNYCFQDWQKTRKYFCRCLLSLFLFLLLPLWRKNIQTPIRRNVNWSNYQSVEFDQQDVCLKEWL